MSQLIFGAVGDIDLSREASRMILQHGPTWPFEKMLPHLRRADILFGNLESVFLPPDYPDDQIDPRGMVDKLDGTPALNAGGFHFLNLAQNHILDGGSVSMFHTQATLENQGIATAGVGKTQEAARKMRVMEKNGLRVGFLCYCEDTNYSLGTRGPCHAYYTADSVLVDIEQNRRNVDCLVVSVHADLEFLETPATQRRDEFRKFARAGATLVLGHHPHVPQGVEMIDGSLIAYSLGNFQFSAHTGAYMRAHLPGTGISFFLLATLERGGVVSFERVPFTIHEPPEQRPTPDEGVRKAAAMAYLERLDAMVRDDAIVRANWRARSLDMFNAYVERLKGADRQRILEEYLCRIFDVAENRAWAREVMAAAREKWLEQATHEDPLHRPHYTITRRFDPPAK